ncbi:hypothetical protein A6043_04675 [[Haemophilus] ducreyi]|uniref:pilus assembly protein n=1 Tax=Haemophilus ducreyi TaxID=730 RepID=UPI0007CDA200|nr:pilus assembly protein [[Haemophilus] ducreyi]ANF70657.1 hypothetical protein A6043_04675 [[Haemophilus] ducreyi]ANF72159.1 hypothetical protein A6044_04440 [[Haemophilus] ducreyi]
MRKYVITQIKRFIQNQSGVYIIFGALLTLPIVALLFVSLEVAGIIQDKARLNDALEQAVLSLTAENNSGRKSYDYALDNAEKANGKYLKDSEAGKRDSQIVKTFVKLYLPQVDASSMEFEPICTTKGNTPTPENSKKYAETSSSHVTCTVTGSINHRSLFPMTVGKSEIIPTQVPLSSASIAQKINNVSLPLDLMVVADLSGSMRFGIEDVGNMYDKIKYPQVKSKLDTLKEVLNNLTDQYLFSADANPHNRIALTPFAMGAMPAKKAHCVLPFKWRYPYGNNNSRVNLTDVSRPLKRGKLYFRAKFVDDMVTLLDTKKTLLSIGQDHYDVEFNTANICLKNLKESSQLWYEHQHKDLFKSYVKSLEADGATLSSTGIIVAANSMLTENPSRTEQLKTPTKRVILILSDGQDDIANGSNGSTDEQRNKRNIPFTNFSRITENLIFGKEEKLNPNKVDRNGYITQNDYYGYASEDLYYSKNIYNYNSGTIMYPSHLTNDTEQIQPPKGMGMCEIITEKLNNFNKDQNTKIVFVEFGYQSESKAAWQKCVGSNYFSVSNQNELLDAFKQAIDQNDDIGHSVNPRNRKKK